jgi:hypothetical protein
MVQLTWRVVMTEKTRKFLRLAEILLIPLIGPVIMFLRGERNDLAAVFLWPLLYCVVGMFISSSRAPRPLDPTDQQLLKLIRRYSNVDVLALFLLCLFEVSMAVLVQAAEAPLSLWAIAFGGLYAAYIAFSLWGDRLRYEANYANKQNQKASGS